MDNNNKNDINDYIYVILLGLLCLLVVGTLTLSFLKASDAVMEVACNILAKGVFIILFIVVPIWVAFSDDGKGRK